MVPRIPAIPAVVLALAVSPVVRAAPLAFDQSAHQRQLRRSEILASGTAASNIGELRAAPTLRDIKGVADLEKLFDADRGKVRMVLLVSPT